MCIDMLEFWYFFKYRVLMVPELYGITEQMPDSSVLCREKGTTKEGSYYQDLHSF